MQVYFNYTDFFFLVSQLAEQQEKIINILSLLASQHDGSASPGRQHPKLTPTKRSSSLQDKPSNVSTADDIIVVESGPVSSTQPSSLEPSSPHFSFASPSLTSPSLLFSPSTTESQLSLSVTEPCSHDSVQSSSLSSPSLLFSPSTTESRLSLSVAEPCSHDLVQSPELSGRPLSTCNSGLPFRDKSLPSGQPPLVERDDYSQQHPYSRAVNQQPVSASGQWRYNRSISDSDYSGASDPAPLSSHPFPPLQRDTMSDAFEFGWPGDEDSDYITSHSLGDTDTQSQWNVPSSSSGSTPRTSRNVTISRSVSPAPPPNTNPQRMITVQQVMNTYTGTDLASLRRLTTALAREAVFGRDELAKASLTGRNSTGRLDGQKLQYIKTLVHSRIPKKSNVEFEEIWKLCKGSLSKSCQTLRTSARKKMFD